MNSHEIIKANLEHSGAPRPGMTFDRGCMDDIVGAGPGNPAGYVQKRWIEGDFEYYDDMWGSLWHRMKDGCQAGEVCRPAIEDWSQLENFRVPVFNKDDMIRSFREGFSKKPDNFKVTWMPGWIFAQARYLRKMENYLMDMALYPDELHSLHGAMSGMYESIVIAAAEADANAICFCEDLGTETSTLFSPDMWQMYYGELYKHLFSVAHEGGLSVHGRGNLNGKEKTEKTLKVSLKTCCFLNDSIL